MIARTPGTVILATVTLAACGDSRPAGAPVEASVRDSAGIRIAENAAPRLTGDRAWRLEPRPLLTIAGDGPVAEEIPLDPASAFFDAQGNLVIADGMFDGWDAILVYGPDGRHLRTLGRSGRGPCEFGQLWWARPYRGDSIAAHDYSAHRITIFGPDGACIRDVPLPRHRPPIARGTYGYADGADGVFDDGTILMYPAGYVDIEDGPGIVWYRHALWTVDPVGERIDSLGEFGITQTTWTGTEQAPVPYGLSGLRAVAGSGFFFGTGETFEVREFDRRGRLTHIIRRGHTPRPLEPDDRQRFTEWYLGLISQGSHASPEVIERTRRGLEETSLWPAILPAYSALLVDDLGYLWVENFRWVAPEFLPPDPEPATWSVFAPDGAWITDVVVPAHVVLRTVQGDRAIGFHRDDNGVAEVRVFRLRRAATGRGSG